MPPKQFRDRLFLVAFLAYALPVVAAAYARGTGSPWPSRPGGSTGPGGPSRPQKS